MSKSKRDILSKEIEDLANEIILLSLYNPTSIEDFYNTKKTLEEKLTVFSKKSFELGKQWSHEESGD